jgi:hypothetical protein
MLAVAFVAAHIPIGLLNLYFIFTFPQLLLFYSTSKINNGRVCILCPGVEAEY